jgi:hypothetical protein
MGKVITIIYMLFNFIILDNNGIGLDGRNI